MIARELERDLADFTGYQPGEIDQRVRSLRERDLIPHGPRGPNAPHLDALHAALVLLTLVARRAADAGQTAMRAMDLKPVARNEADSFGEFHLAAFLAAAIRDGAKQFQNVEILCDGSLAWATLLERKKTRRVLFTDDKNVIDHVKRFPDTYDAQGAMACCHRITLSSGLFEYLHLKIEVEGKS